MRICWRSYFPISNALTTNMNGGSAIIVIWDNRCSVHARRDFPANQRAPSSQTRQGGGRSFDRRSIIFCLTGCQELEGFPGSAFGTINPDVLATIAFGDNPLLMSAEDTHLVLAFDDIATATGNFIDPEGFPSF